MNRPPDFFNSAVDLRFRSASCLPGFFLRVGLAGFLGRLPARAAANFSAISCAAFRLRVSQPFFAATDPADFLGTFAAARRTFLAGIRLVDRFTDEAACLFLGVGLVGGFAVGLRRFLGAGLVGGFAAGLRRFLGAGLPLPDLRVVPRRFLGCIFHQLC